MKRLIRKCPPRAFSIAEGMTLFLLTFMVAGVMAVMPVRGQVAFDTFDDGDVSDVSVFSETGAGIGVGTTDGVGGTEATALSVGVNPADVGSFAGFVLPGGEGVTDVSGASTLSFYVRSTTVQQENLPLTLEINLHEDVDGNGTYEGDTEDEYQAVYRLSTDSEYTFVQIPLAAFGDDNAVFAGSNDGFDFSNLLEIVVAFGGLSGPELTFALDEVVFLEQPGELGGTVTPFAYFDDGDISNVGFFSGTGAGIGVGTTTGTDGAENAALSVGINPADAGAFAGVVLPGGEGTTDISDEVYLRFAFRPTTIQQENLPMTLEINLHEDVNGNGTYEGETEDEYQAVYRVSTGEDYTEVIIPLASFVDDNTAFAGSDDGFDFSNLLEIVVAIGGPTGPELAFAMDQIGFVDSASLVANEPAASELPGGFVMSEAYPNPFGQQAQIDLQIERAQMVRVEVFDLLGRMVDVLHEGHMPAQARKTLRLDASGLSSGAYLIRVQGESFAATRRVIVTK